MIKGRKWTNYMQPDVSLVLVYGSFIDLSWIFGLLVYQIMKLSVSDDISFESWKCPPTISDYWLALKYIKDVVTYCLDIDLVYISISDF